MRKVKRKIKDKYLLIEIINQDSLDKLNSIFKTKYSKKKIKRIVKIKQAPEDFNFYNKLMKEKPKGAKI